MPGCEIRSDDLTRQLYATDASVYQLVPRAVAFPRSPAEAVNAVRTALDKGWSITPRGAGTGLVGGALGTGLVIDFARHNRRIDSLDRERRTVRVDAGVVLDHLNDFLRPHGLQFGPDVATSSRATLGGMIANNSSGARVRTYGVTADCVRSLDVLLADGTLAHISHEDSGLTHLKSAADSIARRYAEAILDRMPAGLLKRWPGYAFDRYLRRPSLVELVGGSEGTLACILSAELDVVPLPQRRALAVLFFPRVEEAMQATVDLLDLQPAAIEHVDRVLFDQTRGQLAFQAARDLLSLDDEHCDSFLIVEFIDNVDDALAMLARRPLGKRRILLPDSRDQALVWGLRKAGLALVTGRPGPAKPVTAIEDVAVRPEQLPEYVAGLRAILDPLQVEASYYGHAAAGLLHVRPILDLHKAQDVRKFRRIAEDVAALVKRFRGSLAGEHGVGIARSEFLQDQLGPELMHATRALKEAFDPAGVLNPGKIVPDRAGRLEFRIDTNLRQGPGYTISLPFVPVLGFVEKDGSFVGNLEQCNGNGLCLKNVPVMCPTYIVTREEIMSTRGRANTIRAALEHRVGSGVDALLSPELEAALGPCLSCKACKTECPSNVDMALLKAELLHARHRRAGVPLVDRMIASADLLGRIGCAAAPLANAAIRSPAIRGVMEWILGIDARRSLPAYAEERFDRWFDRRAGARPPDSRLQVVLWDDTWVRYHEPEVGRAAVRVLEAAGYSVLRAEGRKCCGRPAFSRGLLDDARDMGRHNVDLLEGRYAGLPVVFLEPSCHAMFIDEYRQLGIPHASDVARRCVGFEQFIAELLYRHPGVLPLGPLQDGDPAPPTTAPARRRPVAIHAHCHAKALTDVSVHRRVAESIPEVSAQVLETACCGMAGAYGMMRDKYELSLEVGAPLVEKIRMLPPGTLLVASGTSCRHQIRELAGVRPLHMAELLAMAL